jgi:palmitoyltransferase
VNYLLAWKLININKRDLEGLTPLHLGCMSGNSRVVKRLLLKGADKEIRDNKMMYPRDIARENEF